MSASSASSAASASKPSMAGLAVVLVALLGLTGFLLLFAGASLDAATAGLVAGAGALVFSLATLFRMVQALARPGRTLDARPPDTVGLSRRALREEKRRLLRALNELNFDYELGKLSETDYNQVRQTYELRAVEVLRQLEGSSGLRPEVAALLKERGISVAGESPAKAAESGPAESVTNEAATEDAAEDAEPSSTDGSRASESEESSDGATSPHPGGSEAESSGSSAVEASAELQSQPHCGACDGRNDVDAKFCKHCGKELAG